MLRRMISQQLQDSSGEQIEILDTLLLRPTHWNARQPTSRTRDATWSATDDDTTEVAGHALVTLFTATSATAPTESTTQLCWQQWSRSPWVPSAGWSSHNCWHTDATMTQKLRDNPNLGRGRADASSSSIQLQALGPPVTPRSKPSVCPLLPHSMQRNVTTSLKRFTRHDDYKNTWDNQSSHPVVLQPLALCFVQHLPSGGRLEHH